MASYRLSRAAEEDFENIFDYGINAFGLDQAILYQTGMAMRFDELAAQPMLYTAVDHIYRRSVFGSLSIYYKVKKQSVAIIRILGRQDPGTAFKDQA